ncbi:bacteriocin [Enterococcus faecalis]|uniref:bacteriocin n=1 Tax=Enterococcus faecalis TaxID=1351 RepID=UPI003B816062
MQNVKELSVKEMQMTTGGYSAGQCLKDIGKGIGSGTLAGAAGGGLAAGLGAIPGGFLGAHIGAIGGSAVCIGGLLGGK